MSYLIVAEWDSNKNPTKTALKTTLEQVNEWLSQNAEKYPNAVWGDRPKSTSSKYIFVDEDNATFSFDDNAYNKGTLYPLIDDYRKEVGDGLVSFQGIPARGDKSTRSAIAETIQFWQELDPGQAPETIDWEGPEGFHEISLSTLIGLGKQIGVHRQKTFSVKKAVIDQINAGTITTIDEAKAAFDAGMVA